VTAIVVIDDDDIYGELVQERLASAGYVTIFQHGPFGTINLIRRERPRLVITDVNMPAIRGDALCKLVQATPTLSHTKILFVSSMNENELARVAAEAGANACLPKSASVDELIATVKRLLKE
jgi:DNA-binding response OmpR family regulator